MSRESINDFGPREKMKNGINKTFKLGQAMLDVHCFGSGDPLVLMHGADGLLFCEPFLDALSARHEVLVPCHPGWHGSSRPSHVKTVRDIAELHCEFMESLRGPVPIVGLSFGAWVAAETALLARDMVSILCLISPVGIHVGNRETRNFVDLFAIAVEDRRKVLYSDTTHAPRLGEVQSDSVFFELAKAEEAFARFAWQPYLHDPKLVHRLRRISASTLIISGEKDAFVLADGYYRQYAEAIGDNARHMKIPGAGHRIEEEQAGELAAHIHRFIGEESTKVVPARRMRG